MLSASLVVEGHSHGLGPGHHPHPPHPGIFSEHFVLPSPKATAGAQEFVRPLPKPAPLMPRYNGSSTVALNGCRVLPSSRVSSGAVNLVQHKEENGDDQTPPSSFPAPSGYNARLYPTPHPSYYPGLQNPYGALYSSHYTSLLSRSSYVPPPQQSPLDTFRHSPPQPTPSSPAAAASFLSNTYNSPPTSSSGPPHPTHVKPGQSVLIRERRPFKVPCGKEGSLKHRILTRPPVTAGQASQVAQAAATTTATTTTATTETATKRRVAAGSNHHTLPPNFAKGSLIQLASGELRRVEDMRTEDFVSSAEKSPAVRLDPSTVVRIGQDETRGMATLTLSYGEHRTQVEYESTLEHPFFVYGQGWASCSPERTLQFYGLKCHRLQVGDICISLTPRPTPSTSTSTASNAHHSPVVSRNSAQQNEPRSKDNETSRTQQNTRTVADHVSSTGIPRKRRWSAPDHFLKEEDGVAIRRLRE